VGAAGGGLVEAQAVDERPSALGRAARRAGQRGGQQDVLLARELGHEVENWKTKPTRGGAAA
jgi:hypothetical protein